MALVHHEAPPVLVDQSPERGSLQGGAGAGLQRGSHTWRRSRREAGVFQGKIDALPRKGRQRKPRAPRAERARKRARPWSTNALVTAVTRETCIISRCRALRVGSVLEASTPAPDGLFRAHQVAPALRKIGAMGTHHENTSAPAICACRRRSFGTFLTTIEPKCRFSPVGASL